ncbi:DUF2798 domain-containing protein [Noviherbaspirillum sp. ST9]|uniref:DUF2798 domain-containing protein n=1 Tax=Noviherbaspirillum sp. ST9 TaxID=3401606 RepID=UPI003B58A59B
MIPEKVGQILFGAILSGLMSLLVSGISTFRAIGPAASFFGIWTSAWLTAWLVAFPTVLLAAPLARKLVRCLVAEK